VRPAAFHSAASPSTVLFARHALKAINATVIGVYYLAFFLANTLVGWIGGYLEKWRTTNFCLSRRVRRELREFTLWCLSSN